MTTGSPMLLPCPRCEARDRDPWGPEPGDPFWMLEAEDGEWLKNGRTMLGTRDATKAIRFPTEREAASHPATMAAGYKWWSAKPTEHKWIEREDTRTTPPGQQEVERVQAAARAIKKVCHPIVIDYLGAAEAALSATKDSGTIAELKGLLAVARSVLISTYETHKSARNMVPDEEEGLAAQVFAKAINHADRPIIQAIAKIDALLALQEGRQ